MDGHNHLSVLEFFAFLRATSLVVVIVKLINYGHAKNVKTNLTTFNVIRQYETST